MARGAAVGIKWNGDFVATGFFLLLNLFFREAKMLDLTLGGLPSGLTSGPGKALLSDWKLTAPGPLMSLEIGLLLGDTNLIFVLGVSTRFPTLCLGLFLNRPLPLFFRFDLTLGGRPSGLTWGCLNCGFLGRPRLSKLVKLFFGLFLNRFRFCFSPLFLFAAKMFDLTLGGLLVVVVVTPIGMAVVDEGGGGLSGLTVFPVSSSSSYSFENPFCDVRKPSPSVRKCCPLPASWFPLSSDAGELLAKKRF